MLFLVPFFTSIDLTDCIIGGYGIKIHDAPYQLAYGDTCGAVLIHQRWALTAAHCGTNHTYVKVGSTWRHQGFAVKIQDHIIHPLYQKEHDFDYDVQLLQFWRSLRLYKNVKTIAISKKHGDSLYISGWGYLEERGEYHDTLQQVKINLVPTSSCQNVTKSWYNYTLTKRMFCAGGRKQDGCQGDSGGGAVSMSGKLVGISSFGYGCGRGIPGVYTNVSDDSIRKWIRYHTSV